MVDWQRHERELQQKLGLSSTISSGNKFYDPSDGVDKKHHSELEFQVMIDCKATEKKGYRLERGMLRTWRDKARLWGKTFLLPIRFVYEDENEYTDWVVLGLDDFTEMYELSRRTVGTVVEQKVRTPEVEDQIDFIDSLVKRIPDPKIKLKLVSLVEMLEREFPEGEK